MKVFVSYAFTGEDADLLRQRLDKLRELFTELGVDYYVNMFSDERQGMMNRQATGGETLVWESDDDLFASLRRLFEKAVGASL